MASCCEHEDEDVRRRDDAPPPPPEEEEEGDASPAAPSGAAAVAAASAAGGAGIGDDDDGMDDLPSPDDLRQMANRCFASGEYDSALPLYGLAIDSVRREATKEMEGRRRRRRRQDEAGGETPEEEATTSSSASLSLSIDDGGGGGDGEDDDDDDSPSLSASLVVHLCNRSACLYKMERYEEARDDARDAVRLSGGKNAKASFRLARTQIALESFDDAVDTLDDALQSLKLTEEPGKPSATSDDAGTEEERPTTTNDNLELQRNELAKLRTFAIKKKRQRKKIHPEEDKQPIVPKCVKTETRKPSIREFELGKELGVGNFSRVVTCQHKTTNEPFALKIIEKKKAESLAKRQHPNVYNEIEMERRTLTERLPAGEHPYIVNVYHAFQDYGSLYFLMDLHVEGGDLWSSMRYRNKMVGCHPSLVRTYVYELVDALEYVHSHGIVHRDLKAENVLLSATGHVVLIDFGTAKDLIETDLNGPEFVGTPDFMPPEAVKGSSGPNETEEQKKKGIIGADHTADLWALGAVTYQLLTGTTPFASPSPYLAFLRIQRGNLRRPWGMGDDDDAWDFVRRLMKVVPRERLGADRFELTTTSTAGADDGEEGGGGGEGARTMTRKDGGYDVLRDHPYLRSVAEARRRGGRGRGVDSKDEATPPTTPIPFLRDLCVRSVADLVELDSENVDIDDEHPPGDDSSHDMLRLNHKDRTRVLHVLDRRKLLSVPRVYRRFFKERRQAKLDKVRRGSRDYIGLTQLNDGQGRYPATGEEENADPDAAPIATTDDPVRTVHVTNPLFVKRLNDDCDDDDDRRKSWIDDLKDSVRTINRTRPRAAIASGYLDERCRKILAKINESIPVILNDGSTYFSFWMCGAQGLVLRSKDFVPSSPKRTTSGDGDGEGVDEANGGANADGLETSPDTTDDDDDQRAWLSEELEQSRTARHQTFAFVDCDPRTLPETLLQRLARGRTLCAFGVSEDDDPFVEERTYDVAAARERKKGASSNRSDGATEEEEDDDDDDDDFSASSVDSVEDESDRHTMKLVGRRDGGLRSIVVEEHGGWNAEDV